MKEIVYEVANLREESGATDPVDFLEDGALESLVEIGFKRNLLTLYRLALVFSKILSAGLV